MKLLVSSLNEALAEMIENNIRFKVIGNFNKLDLITKKHLKQYNCWKRLLDLCMF